MSSVRSRRFLWLLPALSLAILALPARASQVRPVNLEEMTTSAASIFSGTVLDVTETLDPGIGRAITLVTFEVDRVAKGDIGSALTVRMLGGESGNVAGVPSFRPGDDVVLFLYGNSDLGLASPVGLGQGRFAVTTDKEGRRIAINDFGNRNLLRGLTPQARERLGASLTEWQSRRDVESDALLDMAASLAVAQP